MALVIALSSYVVLEQKLTPGRSRCCIPVTKKVMEVYQWMVLKPKTNLVTDIVTASADIIMKSTYKCLIRNNMNEKDNSSIP